MNWKSPHRDAGRHATVSRAFPFRRHLGTRGCQADKLLHFLRHHEADTIYLVGDIVDGWALRSSWYWPQAHNDVVQKLLRKGRKGSRVVYIPGNHDEFLRGYYGTHFGGIEVVENAIHEAADGRRFLVVHGDIFDLVVTQARWLALLGDKAYEFALTANRVFNAMRRVLGVPYWSLSKWAKLKVKNAVNFIGAFEKALATEAKHHRVDGVICGHIHTAAMHDDFGLRYINCGDWVESCTAVAERHDAVSRSSPDSQRAKMSRRCRRRQTPRNEKPVASRSHPRYLDANDGHVAREARALGAELEFLTPGEFWTLPLPSYPAIRLALPGPRRGRTAARSHAAGRHSHCDGRSARPCRAPRLHAARLAVHHQLAHPLSRLSAERLPVPERWTCDVTWGWLRRFHSAGAAVLAATPTLGAELASRGFKNVKLWPRGVDANLFRPRSGAPLNLPRPIFLTVGRLAVEKNLEAFLKLDLPGSKLVVGDGRRATIG